MSSFLLKALLILPSLEEQFGLVVLEAMALGLPAIVSNRAGAVDLLVDNLVNGIEVDPLSRAGLVAAMAEIARDEARWERFSLAAREASERGSAAHFAAAVARLADA